MKTDLLSIIAVASLGALLSMSPSDGFVAVAPAEVQAVFGGDCVSVHKLACANSPSPPQGCKRKEGYVTFGSGPTADNATMTHCTSNGEPNVDCGHIHPNKCDGTPF